jgi:hypothetical protein
MLKVKSRCCGVGCHLTQEVDLGMAGPAGLLLLGVGAGALRHRRARPEPERAAGFGIRKPAKPTRPGSELVRRGLPGARTRQPDEVIHLASCRAE